MHKKITPERIFSALIVVNALLCLTVVLAMGLAAQPRMFVMAVGLLTASLNAFGFFWLRRRILAPLKHALTLIEKISGKTRRRSGSTVTRLAKAVAHVTADIEEATAFAVSIGNGNLDTDFSQAQSGNQLRIALEEMRDKLRALAEQEKRRLWHVNGLAKFSELIRQHFNDPEAFSFQLVKNLVQYLDCNQGGMYVMGEEGGEPYLELVACYAFERQKYQKQRLWSGEGLLGQCIREKDTIYLTDIPSNYIRITSGLGKANPACILIVPLKVNDVMHGALELASFRVLEPYQVAFLQALSESIAASLANFKSNQGMQAILSQSQELNNQLQLQEEETQRNMAELQRTQEEMRQNVVMLQATQEEMRRKQMELTGLFSSINTTLSTLEFDIEGRIFHANDRFLNLLGYNWPQMDGRHHSTLFEKEFVKSERYTQLWQRLMAKEPVTDDFKVITLDRAEKWLTASYTPALDANGQVYKIIMLAQDITERKKEQLEFQKLSMVADNTNNSVIITNQAGQIEFVNGGFTQMTGYTLEDCQGRKPGSFLQGPDTNPETVARIRKHIRARKPIYEEILNYAKNGQTYWISLAINPVFDAHGELEKFIAIQADISDTKKHALDYHCKLNAISESNAMVEFDVHGNIIDANPNFLAMTEYTREELLGRHHRVFVPAAEQDSPAYIRFWQQLNQGQSIRDEFRRLTRSGKEIWLRGTYHPILDLNGRPYKIIKFAVDITEQKRLKLASQKQELALLEHLKAINITVASVEFDLQGIITEVNKIFLGVTGYQREELVGEHESVLISPEELHKPQHDLLWSNLKEGQFFSGEFRIKDKSGRDLWLKGTYNPIFDLKGDPYKILMLAQFTTDDKEKEIELSGMVNALKNTAAVLELTPEGTFRNANQRFLDFVGYKRLELRNKALGFFLAEPEGEAALREQLTRGEFFETTLTLRSADGATRRFAATFNPINNLEGQVQKVVVILV